MKQAGIALTRYFGLGVVRRAYQHGYTTGVGKGYPTTKASAEVAGIRLDPLPRPGHYSLNESIGGQRGATRVEGGLWAAEDGYGAPAYGGLVDLQCPLHVDGLNRSRGGRRASA